VSKAGNNEQFDADILQCKVDILRARDIIPLHNPPTPKKPEIQNSTRDTAQSTNEDRSSIALPQVETQTAKEPAPLPPERINHTDTAKQPAIEQGPSSRNITPEVQAKPINPSQDTTAKSGGDGQEKPEIPSFDLAEDIMAEQRKITAIRRKAPDKKTEAQRLKPEVQPVDHIIEEPKPALSEQEKIIAEIVARDIERLCRGDYSADSE